MNNAPIYSKCFAQEREIINEIDILIANVRKSDGKKLSFSEAAEAVRIQRLEEISNQLGRIEKKIC